MASKRKLHDDTLIVTGGKDPLANFGVVNPPVYHASTIVHPTVADYNERRERMMEPGVFVYGRTGTPTTAALETAVAALDRTERALALPSGMAAIAAPLVALLASGDHALVVDSAYYPTRRLFNTVLIKMGVSVSYYAPSIGAGIEALIRPETKLVYVESPGSLTFEMQDIPAIAAVAHAHDLPVVADNTWASPLYCKPAELGADIVVQAATKYIVGHSDAMMGLVSCSQAHYALIRQTANALGYSAAPDDCYLALRGLRTLSVRMEKHRTNALELAAWFEARPEVAEVLHPGLPNFPGHDIWRRDYGGSSGLFGVVLEEMPQPAMEALLDGLELFGIGASWGGYESLVMPAYPHKFRDDPALDPARPRFRVHAGLEKTSDLIADLEAGFDRLNAVRENG